MQETLGTMKKSSRKTFPRWNPHKIILCILGDIKRALYFAKESNHQYCKLLWAVWLFQRQCCAKIVKHGQQKRHKCTQLQYLTTYTGILHTCEKFLNNVWDFFFHTPFTIQPVAPLEYYNFRSLAYCFNKQTLEIQRAIFLWKHWSWGKKASLICKIVGLKL